MQSKLSCAIFSLSVLQVTSARLGHIAFSIEKIIKKQLHRRIVGDNVQSICVTPSVVRDPHKDN